MNDSPRMVPNDPRPAAGGAAGDARVAHWRRTLRITGALLALWFVVTFGVAFFARDLDFDFFGWPFSFWVAGQGALLVYLVIVGVYAAAMHRLDALLGSPEGE